MTDNLNIIKSKIVSSNWDIFWADTIADELPKTTLVLSTPYQAGSAEEAQLQKILQACALTADSYHIIQVEAEQQVSWHRVRDKIKPEFVILFGVMPQQLGIAAMFRLNEPNRFNDCIWVPTLSIQDLEKQSDAKKQLWINGLKPVFVDKVFENNRS
jgi:hypothetical protein